MSSSPESALAMLGPKKLINVHFAVGVGRASAIFKYHGKGPNISALCCKRLKPENVINVFEQWSYGAWATATRTEKRNRFRLAKQQLSTCTTLFGTFFLPSLHDYNVKVPNFTFCRGRKHNFFCFSLSLTRSFRIQLQKNLPTRIGISAIKIEVARIHF